jgi:lysophospholipase L1-like esterase
VQRVFESHPEVGALQCPAARTAATPRKTPTPQGRIPDAAELEEDPARPVVGRAPQLPAELVRRFAWPAAGGERRRIGIWGDSHIAAGFITDELTKAGESRGFTVDTRVIPASAGRPGVRLPLRRVCKSDGWRFQPGYTAAAPAPLGVSLANLRSSGTGDYLWFDLRHRAGRAIRAMKIQYLPSRTRAVIGVRVDDGAEVRVELEPSRDRAVAPDSVDVRATASISTLKLRVLQGEVVLQAFTLEHVEPPALTIDVFGIPSATIKAWANADIAYLTASLDAGRYDAIVLQFGTNEGAVSRFESPEYAATLISSLRSFRRVFPDAACLLVGPTDRGVLVPQERRTRGTDLLRYSRIHQQIARIQSDVGAKFGCAMWDWQRYMGGPGSIYRWARETPPLAAPDLIHLTPSGYRRTAAALAQSLGWR